MVRNLHRVCGVHDWCHRALLRQRGRAPRPGDATWNQSRIVEVHHDRYLDIGLHRRRVLDVDGQDNR